MLRAREWRNEHPFGEDTKERLGHSPDEFDALANTFHPAAVRGVMEAYSTEKDLTDSELEDVFF